MEIYGSARQSTDDNIMQRMRFAGWITRPIDTHSEYVILFAFSTAVVVTQSHLNVTFIRTSPALFTSVLDGGEWLASRSVPIYHRGSSLAREEH